MFRVNTKVVGELTDICQEVVLDGVKDYVTAGARAIPSLTGQARGTYLGMAQSLGLKVRNISQQFPHSKWRSRDRERMIGYGNTYERGLSLGIGTLDKNTNGIKITFQSNLTAAHSGYPYIDEDDWGSRDQAQDALVSYIRENLSNVTVSVIERVFHG